MARRPITEHDFSHEEQAHLRNALFFCRARLGSWKRVAQVFHYETATIQQVATAVRNVTPTVALRMAKLLEKPLEELTSGRFPGGDACPRCGHFPVLDGVLWWSGSTRGS